MKWIARSATWGCEIPIDLIYIITAFILLVIRRRRNKGHNYDSGRLFAAIRESSIVVLVMKRCGSKRTGIGEWRLIDLHLGFGL